MEFSSHKVYLDIAMNQPNQPNQPNPPNPPNPPNQPNQPNPPNQPDQPNPPSQPNSPNPPPTDDDDDEYMQYLNLSDDSEQPVEVEEGNEAPLGEQVNQANDEIQVQGAPMGVAQGLNPDQIMELILGEDQEEVQQIENNNQVAEFMNHLLDDIPPVSNDFGNFEAWGARLPILPPSGLPPPLLPGQFPRPVVMPSTPAFYEAMGNIQNLVALMNNQPLSQSVNNSLRVMAESFESLRQTTDNRGARYPQTDESLLNYLGLTTQQIQAHAGISRGVVNQRVQSSRYNQVGWPRAGNATTMPVMIFYPTGFHAFMYVRYGIGFGRLRREVASVCNLNEFNDLAGYSLWYRSSHEYTPLNDQAAWEVCNELYIGGGVFRIELLVAAVP